MSASNELPHRASSSVALDCNLSPTLSALSACIHSPVQTLPPDYLPPLGWTIDSWRTKPIQQQPEYDDQSALQSALTQIRSLPPLVHPNEIKTLKAQLAEAVAGKRFLLQGGDCAERFMDCTEQNIEAKLKILLQMSLVLTWGANMPTVRIGRVAGQYGKPRSSPYESLPDGTQVHSFKGDNINGFEKTVEARRPDPQRLVQSHFYSHTTMNYIRALIKGGFADLHNSKAWDLGAFNDVAQRSRYEAITQRICHSLDFMNSIGISSQQESVRQVDYFSSHEGLHLDYEAACTRVMPSGEAYNLSGHFLWIGERTRQIDGAHVEFFRGISNPVGVKIGPTITPDELLELVKVLNPYNEPGKLTLITRCGANKVNDVLPPLINIVKASGYHVLWICDPMHGNTYTANNGLKTRSFDDILCELTQTFLIHKQCNSYLGGIHFELTGEHVTECVGGPQDLQDGDLLQRYTTYCDPRLNYSQSLSMSFCISDLIRESREHQRGVRYDLYTPAGYDPVKDQAR